MKIFISYSVKDSKIVDQLATGLRCRGVDVWLDKWEIQPGDLIIHKIEMALDECQEFLLIISSESVNSPFVEHEWHTWMMKQFELEKQARAGNQETRRRIIPIILGKIEIPLFLKPYNYLRIENETTYQNIIEKLINLFKNKVKQPYPEFVKIEKAEHIVSKQILASSMLKDLISNQFEEVIQKLDLKGFVDQVQKGVDENISRLPRIETLLDLIEQRGQQGWTQLEETILFIRSPLFFPDRYGLDSWVTCPKNCWQVDDGNILGMGKDILIFQDAPKEYLKKYSLLTWERLRFHNGCVSGKIWLPKLHESSAAGFAIRHVEGKTALLGLIQHSSDNASSIGLWQMKRQSIEKIYSASLPPHANEWYDFSMDVRDNQLSIDVNKGISFKIHMQDNLPAGHFGLIKFTDSVVKFDNLRLEVSKGERF